MGITHIYETIFLLQSVFPCYVKHDAVSALSVSSVVMSGGIFQCQ